MKSSPIADVQTEVQVETDNRIRCKVCRHPVTTADQAIRVQGGHEHTFRNPAAYSYHVRCFSDAPGCISEGAPTPMATWFAGFDWCFALCRECHEHLGWWYVGAQQSFVGLIATRLQEGKV